MSKEKTKDRNLKVKKENKKRGKKVSKLRLNNKKI